MTLSMARYILAELDHTSEEHSVQALLSQARATVYYYEQLQGTH